MYHVHSIHSIHWQSLGGSKRGCHVYALGFIIVLGTSFLFVRWMVIDSYSMLYIYIIIIIIIVIIINTIYIYFYFHIYILTQLPYIHMRIMCLYYRYIRIYQVCIYPSIGRSIYLLMYLIYLSIHPSINPSIYLSIYLSMYLSILFYFYSILFYLASYLSIYLSNLSNLSI